MFHFTFTRREGPANRHPAAIQCSRDVRPLSTFRETYRRRRKHRVSGYCSRLLPTLWISLALFSHSQPANGQSRPVTLNAVGDILFARGIERKIAAYGEDYPFRSIAPLLRNADVVIGNLETALSDRTFVTNQQYRFRASPERARLLRPAGLTTLNLANNHSLDCGPLGLRDTMLALTKEGIKICGVGSKGSAIEYGKSGGVKTAFLAFSDFPPVVPDDSGFSIQYATDAAVDREVHEARRSADFVVVSFHWGQEQSSIPTPRQKRLARIAASAGADLILGHHPHVLQGFEILRTVGRNTLVAYSLGNFLFDGHKEAEKHSLILRCAFDRTGLLAAEILPVRIEHSAPRAATGPERSTILSRLTALSKQLGCGIEEARVTLRPPSKLFQMPVD